LEASPFRYLFEFLSKNRDPPPDVNLTLEGLRIIYERNQA
jgi:hypothetical protein